MIFAAVYTDEGPSGTCVEPYFMSAWLRVQLFSTMVETRTFIGNRSPPIGRKNPMWRIATPWTGNGLNDGFGTVIDHTQQKGGVRL